MPKHTHQAYFSFLMYGSLSRDQVSEETKTLSPQKHLEENAAQTGESIDLEVQQEDQSRKLFHCNHCDQNLHFTPTEKLKHIKRCGETKSPHN